MSEPLRIEDLIDHVTGMHPNCDALVHLSDAVTTAGQLDDLADQLVGHFVAEARKEGVTWAEIGQGLGVSRQAAQKRFVAKPASEPSHDRFTPRALAAIEAARAEARAAGHNYLGTEHLVLGLLSQPQGLGARAVVEKTTPERLRAAMNDVLGPRVDDEPEHTPYTPRGKRAIELTVTEAERLGHEHVGTEHILLGVLTERLGVGAKVLMDLGVDRNGVEEWLASHG
ncbi:MAG TPA: Clp protease N-terminal domain-containing protein [Umezawaea sp.]|nr:Clp protease N-terminal domain-containing protein [Umezawaea sp.]